ncbi:hypothetical protein SAMN05880570_2217 [Paenibacillus sp. RU4T]|nr:hypothetical protein SAMN05880555_2218 [Paenibacillus sp. RU4X]SIQ96760.1 hypothetical protein SAMN05880570_2217 [Paenibacillus sp. RU4T]
MGEKAAMACMVVHWCAVVSNDVQWCPTMCSGVQRCAVVSNDAYWRAGTGAGAAKGSAFRLIRMNSGSDEQQRMA